MQVIPGVRELKWNVHLHGIPIKDDLKGKEVVVNWELEDFTNSGVFYTDSNGLEMQRRVLDQRSDFELVTDEVVASNYYPINSAIAIVDDTTGR